MARCEAGTVDAAPRPGRLAYVDGLRGAAALYVVLHHAALFVPAAGLSGLASAVRFVLRHGHYAVTMFVVLSGYCLTRRILAGSPEGRLEGGFLGYVAKRAGRIVPPYYAALGVCWLIAATIPAMNVPGPSPWGRASPAFEPGAVASHLLLIHNLSVRWIDRVAPSLWSLATIWQADLILPALLAVRRTRGTSVAVALAFALGGMLAGLAVVGRNPALMRLCPWYFGVFALGMAAASCERPNSAGRLHRGRTLALLLAACVLAVPAMRKTPAHAYVAATDGLVAAITCVWLVRCSRRAEAGSSTPLMRVFSGRRAVGLGSQSYALYLIHYPLLALADRALQGVSAPPDVRLAALAAVAAPICVAASRPFHAVFYVVSRRGRPLGKKDGESTRFQTWTTVVRRSRILTVSTGLCGERAGR